MLNFIRPCQRLYINTFKSITMLMIFSFSLAINAEVGKPLSSNEIDSQLTKQTAKTHTILKTDTGATLLCPMQGLKAEITPTSYKLISTSSKNTGDSFNLTIDGIGREKSLLKNPNAKASVKVEDNMVKVYGNNVIQEFTTKYSGIRQDFIITNKPSGKGRLVIDLNVDNATIKENRTGVFVLMSQGRSLTYDSLHVTDANGKVLNAHFNITKNNKFQISVNDKNAVYPVRVDPAIKDSNWAKMGFGIYGNQSRVYCMKATGTTIYIGGDFYKAGIANDTRFLARWSEKAAGYEWGPVGRGVNNVVYAMDIDADDNLYIGGAFTKAGNEKYGDTLVNRIAKFGTDPTLKSTSIIWRSLTTEVDGTVFAIAADTNSLPTANSVYFGGSFTKPGNNIAKITYTYADNKYSLSITALDGGAGTTTTNVFALDVDSNHNVYVGGDFGGVWAGSEPVLDTALLARWLYIPPEGEADATYKWTSAGIVDGTSIKAIAIDSNDITYIGGKFSTVDDVGPNFARHQPASVVWQAEHTYAIDNEIYSTNKAYKFRCTAGGDSGKEEPTWNTDSTFSKTTIDGTVTWVQIPAWDADAGNPGDPVFALAIDSADNVYCGGNFGILSSASGTGAWADLPGGQVATGPILAIGINGDDDIYTGGDFQSLGKYEAFGDPNPGIKITVNAENLAVHSGATWYALQEVDVDYNALGIAGVGGDYSNYVNAISAYCGDLNGETLSQIKGGVYIGGAFTQVFNSNEFGDPVPVQANNIARWNAGAGLWEAVGKGCNINGINGVNGVNGEVGALINAGGEDVIAGGAFTMAGKATAMHIAKYIRGGQHWVNIGDALTQTEVDGGYDSVDDIPVVVTALAKNSKDIFYAGGAFASPGKYIASFDGVEGGSGSAVGAGVGATTDETPFVYAISVDSSDNVYIGGGFTEPFAYLTKYDAETSTYTDIGGGLDRAVLALAIDSMDMLYVGGNFTTSTAGIPYIAKYDTGLLSWIALGEEVNGPVYDITIDASNLAYIGGDFQFTVNEGEADEAKCNNIAQWDGEGWAAVGTGTEYSTPINKPIFALEYNNSAGAIFVGGAFETLGKGADVQHVANFIVPYLIKYEICTSATYPYYNTQHQHHHNGWFSPVRWSPSREYLVDDYVLDSENKYRFRCIQKGKSGTEEPTWKTDDPITGRTTNDGEVIWKQIEMNIPGYNTELISNNDKSIWQYVMPGGFAQPITAIPAPIGSDEIEYYLAYWTGVRLVGQCGGTSCLGPYSNNSFMYTGFAGVGINAAANFVAHFGRIIHVNKSVVGGNNDGTNWDNAYSDLQDALDDALPYDMIWVAKGTYYPDENNDREKTFTMKKIVRMYGGFDGTEKLSWAEKRFAGALTALLANRDIEKNKTILSGDITSDKSDDPDTGYPYVDDPTDNSYHIVTGPGFTIDSSSEEAAKASVAAAADEDKTKENIKMRLDGFTIEGGYANGTGLDSKGGALVIKSISLEVANCTFKNNFAKSGGAVYLQETLVTTSPCTIAWHCPTTGKSLMSKFPTHFTNCVFQNNNADDSGGAIASLRANTQYAFCTFGVNNATIGGALAIDSYPDPLNYLGSSCAYNNMDSCIFYLNKSTDASTYDNIALNNSAKFEIDHSNIVEPKAGAGYVYPGFVYPNSNIAKNAYFVNTGSIAEWEAETKYQAGDVILYGALKKKLVCLNYGESGKIEDKPKFDVSKIGNVTDDNGIHWQYQAWDPNIDLHLQSPAGHYTVNGWVNDNYVSPSIDSGNTLVNVADEPMPNYPPHLPGFPLPNYPNMGAYGTTMYASKSWDARETPDPGFVVTTPNSSNNDEQGLIVGAPDGGFTYDISWLSQGGVNGTVTLELYKNGVLLGEIATGLPLGSETPAGSGRFVGTYAWNINDYDLANPGDLVYATDYSIVATTTGGSSTSIPACPRSEFTVNRLYTVTFNTDGTANAVLNNTSGNPVPLPDYTQTKLSGQNTDKLTAYIPEGSSKFINWTYTDPITSNTVTTTDNPITIKVYGDIPDVIAHFDTEHTLTVVNDKTGGSTTTYALYGNDTKALVAEDPPLGFVFDEWIQNPAGAGVNGTFNSAAIWKVATAYVMGDNVASSNGLYIFECIAAGNSAVAEPTWKVDNPISGLETTDGTVTWKQVSGASTGSESSTTFTMPSNNITVTAKYQAKQRRVLTVNKGSYTPDPTPGEIGPPEGSEVTIIADDRTATPISEHFVNWTWNTQGDSSILDANSSTTTLTMGTANAEITATYAANAERELTLGIKHTQL